MGTYRPSHNYGPEHAASLANFSTAIEAAAPAQAKKRRHKVSEAQLAANRANAQKSTGPTSDEGKSRCALNAFRHGLTGNISALTKEDRAAQTEFTTPIIDDLKPANAIERQVAHSVAIGHWRLNRIRATEDNIFALGHFGAAADLEVEHPELHAALTSARVFLESSKDFERLTLYEQRIHRNIEKDMAQLESLQAKRKAEREKALEEAAQITRVAELYNEDPAAELKQTNTACAPDGSEFSNAEIERYGRRKDRLKRFAHHEKNYWLPEVEYPEAAGFFTTS